ncbi:zinc finger, CCHC-type containing protein [Tanacetum coccineum]
MVAAAQNTNNTTIRSILQHEKLTGPNFTNWYQNLRIVLRSKGKLAHLEQPTGSAPAPTIADPDTTDKYYETVNLEQKVACLMLSSMSPDIQRNLEKYNAYDMLKELKTKMKSRLNKNFRSEYNKHSMGKTIAELYAMLKLHEKEAKGKDKGKNKLAYAPKPKILSPPKRDNPAKDSVCHHYKEVGHWRRNCPSYQAELKKRKNASVATSENACYVSPNSKQLVRSPCSPFNNKTIPEYYPCQKQPLLVQCRIFKNGYAVKGTPPLKSRKVNRGDLSGGKTSLDCLRLIDVPTYNVYGSIDSYDKVDLFEWEGVSLWEEDNNKNNEIGTNDIIVDEIVDEEIVRMNLFGARN